MLTSHVCVGKRAMGTYRGHVGADLEYPLIFEESMERVVREQRQQQQQQQQSGRFAEPFRYVHLSGMFVCQDQEAQLWFLSGPRKLKGVLETRALAFGQAHAETWRTFIVRPGGIPSKSMLVPGLIASLSRRLFVRVEELGAFMVYLAMDGAGEEESLIEHLRIVEKGRELLLESQKRERT
ncbi:hypothetical protein F4778DRAFT_723950 [Xylariomycetidae sp. FL2044]|nr:hypothetical protein F4778DRAFT_723950 [Xylariomycetidae sp. FL2044]